MILSTECQKSKHLEQARGEVGREVVNAPHSLSTTRCSNYWTTKISVVLEWAKVQSYSTNVPRVTPARVPPCFRKVDSECDQVPGWIIGLGGGEAPPLSKMRTEMRTRAHRCVVHAMVLINSPSLFLE
ncbi:hypothetical protein BsWGS_08792 [Bradybaena similaris]